MKPGNDFYAYANGGWIKATEIPADRSRWGVFSVLAEDTLRQTRALLDETVHTNAPPGTDLRKVADFYRTYLDEAAIDALGIAPLKPTLARISGVKSRQELSRLL